MGRVSATSARGQNPRIAFQSISATLAPKVSRRSIALVYARERPHLGVAKLESAVPKMASSLEIRDVRADPQFVRETLVADAPR